MMNFFDKLSEPYLQRPLFAVVILGVLCSIIGVFIVLRSLVFMGQGIAHSAFAGGALGILLGINPFITIFIFSTGMSVTVGYINERSKLSHEIAVGIFFSFFMGLAVLFIGLMKTYSTDVNSLLFGNALTVSTEDLVLLLVVAPIVLVLFFLVKRELFFVTFDEEMARADGIPVRFLNYLFLILVSATIVVSMKALGAILVMAMIVTPAAAAYQWTYGVNRMLVLSVAFGVSSAFFGLMLSYTFDVATGPMIVSVSTAIFFMSFGASPKRRRSHIELDKCLVCQKAIEHVGECEFCSDHDELGAFLEGRGVQPGTGGGGE
ncbi:MAG: metal ABC transporter permease [Promethearchaeota archaeon]